MIILNGIKELKTKDKLKFHLLKFHEIFDGLIGTNIMKQLGIIIDIRHKKLILPTHTMELKGFKPGSKNINFTHELPRTQLEELFYKYDQIFDVTSTLPYSGDIEHVIELTNEKPIHRKQYRYPNAQIPEIKRQVKELLQNDIIQESKSPWNSPIIIVNKKDDESGRKKFRMVIDYRELNAKTIDDRFPVPNIEELLDQLNGCKYFSIIDLKSGFHQVKMNSNDIPKTAFSVLGNHYEFKRMPFGLKNAPSTFLRLMNRTLNKYIGKCCLCYMDDIIVFSKTKQEHLQNLEAIFKILINANMRIQLDKCKFMEKEIKFLGHIVNQNGIQPDPEKIETIRKIVIPKTAKQIKQFLGLIGYYRKFIKNFAEKTKPISKLLKKGAKINPKDNYYINCFEECKQMLTSNPILEYPDFNRKFRLTTDASDYALGAILSHDDTDKPIAYASRTLSDTECRYDATNKELLAIVWACKHFRPYIYGSKFEIHTDHRPLEWLMSLKDPSSKLVRWRLKLSEFEFNINYKKGTTNNGADALSRLEINTNETSSIIETLPITSTILNKFQTQIIFKIVPQEETIKSTRITEEIFNNIRYTYHKQNYPEKSIHNIMKFIASKHIGNTAIVCDDLTAKYIAKWIKQKQDIKLNIVRTTKVVKDLKDEASQNNILQSKHSRNHKNQEQTVAEIIKEYYFPNMKTITKTFIENCEICNKNRNNEQITTIEKTQPVIDTQPQINIANPVTTNNIHLIDNPVDQLKIIMETHNTNHRGMNENYAQIKKAYRFGNIKEMITAYIKKCDTCNRMKYDRNPLQVKLQLTQTASKPNERIHIDTFSLRTKQFLTIIDAFSRFASTYDLPNRETITIINTLKKHFSQEGIPGILISDSATEFTSQSFTDFTNKYKFNHHVTTPKSSTGNSIIERLHSTLTELIRIKFDEHRKIKTSDLLTEAILAYNNSIHSATGYTPMELHRAHMVIRELPEELSTEEFTQKLQTEYQTRANQIYEIDKRNKENRINKINKTKTTPPILQTNDTIFERIHTRDKTAPKYIKHIITENRNGPTATTNKRTVHKKNIKRHAIITGSPPVQSILQTTQKTKE